MQKLTEAINGVQATRSGYPKVKSLQKAIHVLKCFSLSQPELGVTDIGQMLGIQKSTVHNILSTFEYEGLVEQDPETRKYRLSVEMLHLGSIVREGLGLRKVALPLMHQVKDAFEETVHLATKQDGYVVYLESVQPPDRSVARLATGKRASMHCTGVGKAILAFAPPKEVKAITEARGMEEYTPNTITSLDRLMTELETIRTKGFATDNMEHEWGIRCIAVPIRDESGQVNASMSVSGPSERFPLESIDEMAQTLVALGNEVSRRLGWPGQ